MDDNRFFEASGVECRLLFFASSDENAVLAQAFEERRERSKHKVF